MKKYFFITRKNGKNTTINYLIKNMQVFREVYYILKDMDLLIVITDMLKGRNGIENKDFIYKSHKY